MPTAIFGALVLPDVFLSAGSLDLGLNNLYLWSTVIIFPLVYKTKSLGLADSQRRRRLCTAAGRTLINRHSLQHREESALEIFLQGLTMGLAYLAPTAPKIFLSSTRRSPQPLGIALVTAGIVAS